MSAVSTVPYVKAALVAGIGGLTEFAGIPVTWGDPGGDLERTAAYVGGATFTASQLLDTFDGDRSERYEIAAVISVIEPGSTQQEVETVACGLAAAVETWLRGNSTLGLTISGVDDLEASVASISLVPAIQDQGAGADVAISIAIEVFM